MFSKILILFLFAQTLSVIGTAVTGRALPIALSELSGGTALTGSLLAIAAIPTLILTPLLGVWAERAQPRALVGLNLVFAAASVMLAAGVHTKSVGLILAALLASQAVGAAFNPVYNRILVALTPPGAEAAAKIGQIQSISSRLATALGEGSAPALLAATGAIAFLVDAGSFMASGAIAAALPEMEAPVATQTGGNAWLRLKGVFSEAIDGFAAVDKGLLLLILAAFAVWTSETAVLVALPAAKPVLGLLFAVKGGAEFLTVSAMAAAGLTYTNTILARAGVVLGVSSLLLASSSYLGTDYATAVVFGGAVLSGIGSNLVGGGVWNRLVFANREYAGRISATTTVATKAAEVGFLLITTQVADLSSPAASFAGAGSLMIVATLVVFGYFKPAE